jgi:hypothetical protein
MEFFLSRIGERYDLALAKTMNKLIAHHTNHLLIVRFLPSLVFHSSGGGQLYPCNTKNSSQNSSAVIFCRQSPQNEYSSPPTAIIGTTPTLDSLISEDPQKKHFRLSSIGLVHALQLNPEQEGADYH